MLTDLQIRKIETPDQRREVPDGKITGLFLVVQPTGAKSWAVRYRADGKPKKFTLGPYPAIDLAAAREARKAAAETADRVAEVVETFIARYVKRKTGDSWAREGERLLRKEIIPALGKKRLGDVKKSDVHDMLDAIVDRGAPIVANRTLAIFRRLCNWATERGIIAASPCEKIQAPAVLPGGRSITSGGRSAQSPNCSCSPARRDEIGSATWSEIDLAAKTWTIAKERSKNGVAHEIPLSDAAVAIIKTLPKVEPKRDENGKRYPDFIFTTTGKTSVSGFSKAKDEIDAAILAALTTEAGEGANVEAPARWTFHDLRRTAASGMAGLGIPPHVVEAALNHKSGMIKGVAAVYNRYSYAAEKRAALDAWARRLDAIVNPSPASNVVELAKARG
jgi:integrase